MVDIGVNIEGKPNYLLKKLENGFVVPDASITDIHQNLQSQIQNQVRLAVAADTLGYDYAIHPEHHFSLSGAISPNPVVTQSVVAAQTDDIRLLQMANILPWHEPVRLAEQLAMLDLVSDGRADVGIGTGFGTQESETLGQYWGGTAQDTARNWESFEEKYELLVEAWTEDFVAHHGQFHDVPPTYTEWENNHEYHYLTDHPDTPDPHTYMQANGGTTTLESLPVFPQPQQQPHPQIWRPTTSPNAIEWAAHRGINGVCLCDEFSDVRDVIDQYYAAAEDAGWPDHRPDHDGDPFRYGWDTHRRRGVACGVTVFNTEVADEETVERWKLGQEFQQSSSKGVKPPEYAAEVEIDAESLMEANGCPIVGDTEEIIDQLATFEDVCGYEDFIVFVVTGATGLAHEEKKEQLRAFAEEVVPYFADR